jgi:hypothetical protein
MVKCRCAMCGRKNGKCGRNSAYRNAGIGTDELLPRGKTKVQERRRLRRIETRSWAHL